jgi:hypothetical protein
MQFGGVLSTSQVANNFMGTGLKFDEPPIMPDRPRPKPDDPPGWPPAPGLLPPGVVRPPEAPKPALGFAPGGRNPLLTALAISVTKTCPDLFVSNLCCLFTTDVALQFSKYKLRGRRGNLALFGVASLLS